MNPFPSKELNSSPASSVITFFTFTILLILCINTVVDLRTNSQVALDKVIESFQKELHGQGNSIGVRHRMDNSDKFILSDFFRIDDTIGEPAALTSVSYPKGGAAIAILISNSTKDVNDLRIALKSLVFLRGDLDKEHPSPVLIFHDGDLSTIQRKEIVSSSVRPVSFPVIDFEQFPDGLNLDDEDIQKFRVEGRDNPWGYQQMIRFWITRIWEHPALEPFEIIMRMDSDSCFKTPNQFLPWLKNDDIVYHSQFVGVEGNANFTKGLIEHAETFLKRYNKSAGNPMLWRYAKLTWEGKKTLPLLMTNFEVSRKSWMQKNIVKRWHESLTEEKPYGIFKHRWGDAVTRYLMVALLTQTFEVDTSNPVGYFHKEKCTEVAVDAAISAYRSILFGSNNDNQ